METHDLMIIQLSGMQVGRRPFTNDLKFSGKNRHGPLPLTAKTGLTLSIMTISYAWAVSQFHGFALSAVSALSGPLGTTFNIISCSPCQFAVLSKLPLTSSKTHTVKMCG